MNRGLIEAPRSSSGRPTSFGLPRFMNRGLIEAINPSGMRLTAAVLPRFMNRGLIEALLLMLPRARGERTSPIHESGPH